MIRTEVVMGTLVTMEVIRPGANDAENAQAAMDRAFGWFHEIEERCTRFNPESELMRLSGRTGEAVPASAILFEALRFAVAVAEETEGVFDPTVGHRMASRGFNREHRTGEVVQSPLTYNDDVSYRDVSFDPDAKTITLRRPLTFDLGAVAKGLAIDTAGTELRPFRNFAIDAGGDLYFGGSNAEGTKWAVGIRHPRRDRELIDTLRVSDRAVCTSGDYERPGHIVLDRGSDQPAVASATVVADTAMLADALSTAAFALGPVEGIRLLDRMGVEGLIITPELRRYETRGFHHVA